jgi:predicted transcriptional regulator
MKAVLISIQPKWCELIASGKKMVEVRKTKPKIEIPFKCYIYETQGRTETPFVDEDGHEIFKGRGQVIGEFVCNAIEEVYQCNSGWVQSYACLSRDEFFDYLGIPRKTHLGYDKKAYGWLISDLVIYDKPKELREFKRVCDGNCQSCQYAIWQTSGGAYEPYIVDCKPITRPPQSWCYVEELR